MPKVYKYIKKQFLDAMLGQGTILISSLHKFREAENVEIGDAGEGIITIEGMLPNYRGINVSGDEIPDAIQPYFQLQVLGELTSYVRIISFPTKKIILTLICIARL
jgi:hypothetical protein